MEKFARTYLNHRLNSRRDLVLAFLISEKQIPSNWILLLGPNFIFLFKAHIMSVSFLVWAVYFTKSDGRFLPAPPIHFFLHPYNFENTKMSILDSTIQNTQFVF